MKEQENK